MRKYIHAFYQEKPGGGEDCRRGRKSGKRASPEEARTAEEGVNQVREQARGGEDCRRGRKSGKRASPEKARTAEEGVYQEREQARRRR